MKSIETEAHAAAQIRVGVGGWNFAPWRDNFYPRGLAQAKELAFASRKLSAIEINATFYRTQTPQSFRRWAEETPGNFVFAIKAHRFTTHRKSLAEAGSAVEHFIGSGLSELGPKLGPLVWQFAPTKRFEPGDFEAFLALLPKELGARKLRHVLEVRHESFCVESFVALARHYNCAICIANSAKYPLIADVSADFVYVRLQKSSTSHETGYAPDAIENWLDRAKCWAAGGEPEDLPYFAKERGTESHGRDSFIFFIAGAKERNPAAACALLDQLAHESKEARG